MSSTDNRQSKLEQIPNSVSGDGKTFVAQLKRFLQSFRDDTQKKIDGIGAGAVEQVFGLRLTEQHDYDSKGNPINNIFVEFDNTNVTNYLNAQIWMKKSTENAYHMVGTTSNVTYTIPDVNAGTTYYVKVVACNTNSGTADFDDAPYEDITIQGSVLVPSAPTQFYLTFDDEGPLWEWQFVDNGYVDFFELRLDGLAGTWNANRLDSTRNSYSRANPPVRSGTAYLFIRNIYGTYSQPATHTFNISAPAKPNAPTLEMTLDGVVITMDPLPVRCTGYELEIIDWEDTVNYFETTNNQFVYFQFTGGISVRYRFLDSVGYSEWSNSTSGNMKTVLNLIDLPEISYSQFDAATKAAVDKATTALNAVDDLNDRLLDIIVEQGEGTTEQFTLLQNQVNADSGRIDTVIANLSVTPDGSNSYAAINTLKQTADGISSTVSSHTTSLNTVNTNISNLTQRANGFDTTVQTIQRDVATNATNISQTSTDITAVVTELSKTDPTKVNYAAITALSNGIDLCVKDTDLTGKEIVNRINIQPTVTTIDGKYLHVTGNTVFDGSVIVGGSIKDGAISAGKIASNAVTSAKIYNGAVTEVKLGNGAVSSGKLADGAVTSGKVAEGAIGQVAIADGAVIAKKIAANAVTAGKIAANAVDANQIKADAVTADKIAAKAVTAGKIDANAVTATEIKAGSVIADKIAASAVTTAKLAAGAVTAQKIYSGDVQANRIQANNIAAGAITADKISVNNLQAVSANVGNLTGGSLTGTTLIGGTIRNANSTFTVSKDGAIKGASLTSSSMTSGTITGGTITGATIIGSTIKNAANTFSVDANGNIKGAKLTAGTIEASMITSAGFTVRSSVIISGELEDGATIPLPSGYTAVQCLWSIYPKPKSAVVSHLVSYDPNTFSVDNSRKVTVGYGYNYYEGQSGDSGYDWISGKAYYRVIGIK